MADDDSQTKMLKSRASGAVLTIDRIMNDNNQMNNHDQQHIARALTGLEDRLSNAGRQVYGTRWNSIGCGAGFAMARCGSARMCMAK